MQAAATLPLNIRLGARPLWPDIFTCSRHHQNFACSVSQSFVVSVAKPSAR